MRWIPPAVAGALGLYQLSNPSIWIDEATTARAVKLSFEGLIDELHWLYYTVLKPWTMLVGTSELALRIMSVVGAVIAAALLYDLARKLFDERIAFVGAMLLAINPLVVKWSQQARGYTILLALVVGSTWLLLRALETDARIDWALLCVALIVMIHWHWFSAFLFLPVLILTSERSFRALLTYQVALVVSIPWLAKFIGRPETNLPISWIPEPGPREMLETLGYVGGAFGVGVVLAAVGAWHVTQHRRLLLTWALLPFALALTASLVEPVFLDRYLIVSAPAFAVLGAVGIVELARAWQVVAVGAVVIASAIGLAAWYAPDGSDNWAGENWREATEFVMRAGGGRTEPEGTKTAFIYYGGRWAENGWVIERSGQTGFDPSPYVKAEFGARLRVLRLPDPP